MSIKDIGFCVDDRPHEGVFRVHPDVFADEELFELEQRYVFERTWNFLGIESQVAKPHDYVTTHIGRTPVVLMRDANGRLGAFLNACRHKGAVVCRTERGNRKYHACPYHGWAYDSGGRSVDIKDREAGCYAEAFDRENHDLIPLARVECYQGLIFGSMSPAVPPIGEFLGELRTLIDLAMEQGPNGMEFVPGRATYTFNANWKLQMDNGLDAYHLTSTHASFLDVMARRREGDAGNQAAQQFDWAKRLSQEGGMFTFPNGHAAIWLNQPEPEKRPIYPALEEVAKRVGPTRAEWMLKLRNVTVFPNMQIADSTSLILRTFRPLSVNRTEMRVCCMAPIGEAPELRAWRLRQFEDFFNASGFATPDDTVIYEECQRGYAARQLGYLQGCSRGLAALVQGKNEEAGALGFEPETSLKGSFRLQSETCFHSAYREWARLMRAGLSGQPAYGGKA